MLEKILKCNHPTEQITNNLEQLLKLIPEMKPMIGFDHKNSNHNLDVFKHTLKAIELSENDFTIRLVLLLHDIGKPYVYTEKDGIRHYKGHEQKSQELAKTILTRLNYDPYFINKICYLIKKHDTLLTKENIETEPKTSALLLKIQYCDAYAHHPKTYKKRQEYLEETRNMLINILNKIIFLDIDGVLVHKDYEDIETENIDPNKIKILKQIIDQTQAKIVLTSSWKGELEFKSNDKKTPPYFILEKMLKDQNIEIFDITPNIKPQLSIPYEKLKYLSPEDIKKVTIDPYTTRGGEIHKWIEINQEPLSFVIIDDETSGFEYFGYDKNLIKTDYYDNGLKEEHIEKAVKILNSSKIKTR